ETKQLQLQVKTLQEDNKKIWEAINKNSEDIKLLQLEVKTLQEETKQLQLQVKTLQEETKQLQLQVKTLQEDNKKIWEAINKNSEDIKLLHEDNKKIWEAINRLTMSVRRLGITVGSFTGRTGVYMERTMLKLYSEALKLHGIDASKVRSTKIVDQAGVYHKGKEFQVDIIEDNGITYLFEIKNYGDDSVLEQALIRRKVLEGLGKTVKAYIVANMVEDMVKMEAEKEGITVLAGYTVKSPRRSPSE
ncbi:MAG: hypothetical protein QW688_07920, partial [Thermoprotei archaeon]